MLFRSRSKRRAVRPSSRPSARPSVEALESRLVPYALSGNAWPNPQLITISFVPDGTVVAQGPNGPITSNLFSTFNGLFNNNTTGWQDLILKAAQTWAVQTNINFSVIPDSGADSGSGSYQQGDPTMGDIRIGGYAFANGALATTFYPPSANNYSVAGDVDFNTAQSFAISTTYDVYTVALHEIGHALGMAHSSSSNSVMYGFYTSVHLGLANDDIAGIRAIYSNGSARAHDAYNTGGSDGTFATASNLTSTLDPTALTADINNLDITTAGQAEYFTFTAPSNSAATMNLDVQSSGLSLLAPKVTVYAADQRTVLGSANGLGQYGTTLTLDGLGLTPGATYYVKVQGADTTAFGTGHYALTLNLGTGADPSVPLPNTQVANGNPLTSGGGVPLDPSRLNGLGQWLTGNGQGQNGNSGNMMPGPVAPAGTGLDLPPLMCNCPACLAMRAAMIRSLEEREMAIPNKATANPPAVPKGITVAEEFGPGEFLIAQALLSLPDGAQGPFTGDHQQAPGSPPAQCAGAVPALTGDSLAGVPQPATQGHNAADVGLGPQAQQANDAYFSVFGGAQDLVSVPFWS